MIYALWAFGGPRPAPGFYFDRVLGVGFAWLALWLFAFAGTIRHRRWGAGLALFLAGLQTLVSSVSAYKLPYNSEGAADMPGMFVLVYAALLTGILLGVSAFRAFRTPTSVFEVSEDGLLVPEPLGRAKLALMSGILLMLTGICFLVAGYAFVPELDLGPADGQLLGTDEFGNPVEVNWRREELPAMGFSIELPDEPRTTRHTSIGGAVYEITVSTEYLLMSVGSKGTADIPEGKEFELLWRFYNQLRWDDDRPFEEVSRAKASTHRGHPALKGGVELKDGGAPGQVMVVYINRRVIVFFGFTHRDEQKPVIERSRESIQMLK
jgi:hypothetical protein